MIAFDTNYLVRHIVQDDAKQSQKVKSILQSEIREDRTIRLFDSVILETAWVLQTVYGIDRAALAEIVEELLDDAAFSFDSTSRLRSTVEQFRIGKADFADYLILNTARSEGLNLQNFDKRLLQEMRS